jgi:hypothetical protein
MTIALGQRSPVDILYGLSIRFNSLEDRGVEALWNSDVPATDLTTTGRSKRAEMPSMAAFNPLLFGQVFTWTMDAGLIEFKMSGRQRPSPDNLGNQLAIHIC